MIPENHYKGIKHTVKISTHIGECCELCDFPIGLENFAESVNHYIEKHGYKILHIGSETGDNSTQTIAILGK